MESTQIRFSGSGGQGLLLSAKILAAVLADAGKNVAQSQSYEPVSRGGLSRADLVITDGEAAFPLSNRLDYLLVLHSAAVGTSDHLLDSSSMVLVDSELVPTPPSGEFTVHSLPFTETARKLGNKRVANIVALSALVSMSGICSQEALEAIVKSKTPAKFSRLNTEALEAGKLLAIGTSP